MTENIVTRSELAEGFVSRVTVALAMPHTVERRAEAPKIWDVMDGWMERGERLIDDAGHAFDVLQCDDIGRLDELVMGTSMLAWEAEVRALHCELSMLSIGEEFDTGRLLLRAMLETLMKQMVNACREYLDMIRRYRRDGEIPNGPQEIELSATTESAALQRWIKQQCKSPPPPAPSPPIAGRHPRVRPSLQPATRPSSSCESGIGSLLVAFGLGWWIGGG